MYASHHIFLAFIISSLSIFTTMVQATEEGKWIALFDGSDLANWDILNCEALVQDDAILLKSGNGLVQTKEQYADFVLDLEWKALHPEKWDSGIYFRYTSVPENQPWPGRYQANLRKGMEGNVNGIKGATSMVVFPDPLAPASSRTSRGGTARSTWARAQCLPNLRPNWRASMAGSLPGPRGIAKVYHSVYLPSRRPGCWR